MNVVSDLNDMMLFVAVVDAGSFTLAADRLAMPKANLSRKISRLEKRLGVILLERTTRSQHITEAGQLYLTHCRSISAEVGLAEAAIAQVLNKVEGQLKIGASVGMGHDILKPVLGTFMRQYPEIKLQLELLNQRVDLIEEGFDLVIRIGDLDDSRLIAKRLGQVSRKLYVSPHYLQQHGAIKSINQLAQYDFLLMTSVQNEGHLELVSGRQKQTLKIAPKMLVDDYLILKQMVVEGIGIAVLPDYMCEQQVHDGSLVPLLGNWGMPDVDVYALYPKHKLNIPKVKAFMLYIQEVFNQRLNT
ncbi:LysR family transcriptional regulator [Agarivorans sp. 1_MG-2023]|uniref:LysR family transcriptional regulator n=1 Tax=Agarivorans sp. 1_MG-2023 TaxID=3062634 RepID=UPI0026E1813C|nr:LysR family transcriptional regulator [Agarivorans sp. 1_MG-2023]MDO6763417.1 LysR family transcriptional regulator [Agarivorans sp. 1_MG-2023]